MPPNVVPAADDTNWIVENLILRLPPNHLDVLHDKAVSIRVSISEQSTSSKTTKQLVGVTA